MTFEHRVICSAIVPINSYSHYHSPPAKAHVLTAARTCETFTAPLKIKYGNKINFGALIELSWWSGDIGIYTKSVHNSLSLSFYLSLCFNDLGLNLMFIEVQLSPLGVTPIHLPLIFNEACVLTLPEFRGGVAQLMSTEELCWRQNVWGSVCSTLAKG